MDRRSFVKTCTLGAGMVAGGTGLALPAAASARRYNRLRLLNDQVRPLRAAEVVAGTQYVFHYPFAATPCFLLNLDRPVPGRTALEVEGGGRYDWAGGVGPGKSLVAFSAICAHKMAHPTRGVSYINFRARRDDEDPETGVISCCAENSRYDPFNGGAVLSGPAPQPLAAIVLEYDESEDELFVSGTIGGEMFQRFFSEFEARLSLEHPSGNVRSPLADDIVVQRLEDFTANLVSC